MAEFGRENRIPVSTVKTGCVPFNIKQRAAAGYKIGETPVKNTGEFVDSFDEALRKLRTLRVAGWRDYGPGNSQGARKAIGWVTKEDAERLLAETDSTKRISLFNSLSDVAD